MRSRVVTTLAFASLLALACQDQVPSEPLTNEVQSRPVPVTSHGQPGKWLAIRGSLSGNLTGQVLAPGFPVARDLFDGRCSVPSDWVVEFTVSGVISHLGNVTAVLEHCSQIDFQTGNATYGDGVVTIVAANGDELWATYDDGTSGPLSAAEVWWQDTFTLTGGTGRFEHASGGGTEWGTALLATFAIPGMSLEGMISYDASDSGP